MSGHPAWRGWLIDTVAGVLVGALVGLIAVWNLSIFLGVEGGYQASLVDVFEHGLLAGVLATGVLLSGPAVGIWVARRQRHKRALESDGKASPADRM
ncbi:MAG TPA: hypothetical protein VEB69_08650 [Acidimicrobiia bacterium]|nr:hypothetical protein [Acidimicrobiia bacterium]